MLMSLLGLHAVPYQQQALAVQTASWKNTLGSAATMLMLMCSEQRAASSGQSMPHAQKI